jgi:hypothetical protein
MTITSAIVAFLVGLFLSPFMMRLLGKLFAAVGFGSSDFNLTMPIPQPFNPTVGKHCVLTIDSQGAPFTAATTYDASYDGPTSTIAAGGGFTIRAFPFASNPNRVTLHLVPVTVVPKIQMLTGGTGTLTLTTSNPNGQLTNPGAPPPFSVTIFPPATPEDPELDPCAGC